MSFNKKLEKNAGISSEKTSLHENANYFDRDEEFDGKKPIMHFFTKKLRKKSKVQKLDIGYLDKRTPFWKPLLMLTPTFIIIGLFLIYPFFNAIFDAFYYPEHPADLENKIWGFGKFVDTWQHEQFQHGIKMSISYTLLQVPLSICISLLISSAIVALARKFAKSFFQTVFFLPYVTSGVAVALAFAFMFDARMGLVNTLFGIDKNWLSDTSNSGLHFNAFWVILINGVWGAQAFQVLIFTTAMLSVDRDRYKSAAIDGSGPIRQFFRITIPSINRTLNFIITMGVIGSFKVFPLALFQSNPETAMSSGGSTLVMFIFYNGKVDIARSASASIILVVLSICLSVTIKSLVRFTVWGTEKWGEKSVQIKIKNSTIRGKT